MRSSAFIDCYQGFTVLKSLKLCSFSESTGYNYLILSLQKVPESLCCFFSGLDPRWNNLLETVQSSLSFCDWVKDRRGLEVDKNLFCILHPYRNICNFANSSLLYCYLRDKCSDEFHSLLPPFKTITSMTRHSTPMDLHGPHLSRVQNENRAFVLPETAALWKCLPCEWFLECYNHNHFKWRVSAFLSPESCLWYNLNKMGEYQDRMLQAELITIYIRV